jgi:hypothetical protein
VDKLLCASCHAAERSRLVERTYRYVRHHDVVAYLDCGWAIVDADMAHHGFYGVLMAWLCECRCVEPRPEEQADYAVEVPGGVVGTVRLIVSGGKVVRSGVHELLSDAAVMRANAALAEAAAAARDLAAFEEDWRLRQDA